MALRKFIFGLRKLGLPMGEEKEKERREEEKKRRRRRKKGRRGEEEIQVMNTCME